MEERRSPAAFPIDDQRVYDAYISGRMAAALAASVRCGLFDLLAQEPLGEDAIATRLGFSPRGVRSLVTALLAIGLLEARADRIALSADAAEYLVRGKPGYLGALIELEVEHFLSPASLLAALARGSASVYGSADPWEQHAVDPEQARRFTEAMHSVSARPAAGLAEVVDFSHTQRLLDVGGGSGALSIAIAKRWPRVFCAIWDLSVVCNLASGYVVRAGVGTRVLCRPGDMFRDPFPAGFDAILFSQILHDWPPAKDAQLLQKAFAALPPGGMVLVHEKLVDEDRRSPLANALVNLDMLVWTEGQQLSEPELRALLERAGFIGIERKATAGYWSVMIGRRPG